MRLRMWFLCALLGLIHVTASSADLSFKTKEKGSFSFDTGAVRGTLQADDASQGIPSIIDIVTGTDLAHGAPGLLSYYRLLSTDKRWGENFRGWPKTAKLQSDGAVEVIWPPQPDHPVEMRATYRWKSANILDLETVLRPESDMSNVEVFLSSYFNKGFRGRMYVAAPRHTGGQPYFLSLMANPFTIGTYLAFPRDLEAARIVYDGRWERGTNPVQFSINRYYAAPLALKTNAESGVTVVQMSRPDDCFAVEAPYDKDPPDGPAGHYSLYLSLFGRNLQAGQTARALTRMVVERNVTDERALALYQEFLRDSKSGD